MPNTTVENLPRPSLCIVEAPMDVQKREDRLLDYICMLLEERADLLAVIALMEADK